MPNITDVLYKKGIRFDNGRPTTVVAETVTTTRVWSRTPGFAAKKKSNSLPMLGYTYNRTIDPAWCGYETLTQKYVGFPPDNYSSVGFGVTGLSAASPSLPTASQENALDRYAITGLLNKVKDQKINLAQFVAEREQTIHLIAQTAVRLAQMYTSLRRGDVAGAASAVGATVSRSSRKRYQADFRRDKASVASKYWLELQYGWKPLLQDLYGAAEAAGKIGINPVTYTQTVRKSVSVNKKTVSVQGDYTVISDSSSTLTFKYTVHYGHSYVNPNISLASQLGLTNPALLAWELLPFSFVVDWILPVGNSLQALDATLGLSFINGTKTRIVESKVVAIADRKFVPSGVNVAGAGRCNKQRSEISISRAPLSDFPSPTLPSFKNPISFTHFWNATALLTLAFRR